MNSNGGQLQWHPRIHEVAGQESLHYWFLSFSTNFEWERLRDALRELFDEHGVTSFALYELMGDFDMLLRVWLPSGTAGAFRRSLQDHLDRFSLAHAHQYSVETVIRHWPFSPEGMGELKELDDQSALPPNGMVQTVNQKLAECTPASDPELEELVRSSTLGPPPGNTDDVPGVKIVTLIKPVQALPPNQKRALGRQLARVLDEQPSIRQRSLYQVDGYAAFLLTCLAPKDDFFTFRERLIRDVSPLLETAGARTNSYACASRNLVMFQDLVAKPHARTNNQLPTLDIEELLALEESKTLEVKGSAFAPLEPWLFQGEELGESPRFFHRGALRSLVGFLNTEGGSIVIGGLEAVRYRDRLSTELLREFRHIGTYLCCGLKDPTFTQKGWDAYERKIGESIANNVTPDPSRLLHIRKERFEGVDFCIIDVQSGLDENWHYLDPQREHIAPQFLVRQGARTVELGGIEADRYKQRRQDP